MEAAVGGEKDGRSDDPEVDGTSTHLCLRVAHEPRLASEPNVALGGEWAMTIALAFLAILQGIITVLESRRSARHIRTFRPAPRSARERIAVFCPCKGTDPEFEKNIRSILDQDYGNYETHFMVESSDDPAYTALSNLGASNILIAGRASDRGQKVHNLAYAVAHAGGNAAIYVFCDADARFPHDWLSKLTAPLAPGNIATGYRWYAVTRA